MTARVNIKPKVMTVSHNVVMNGRDQPCYIKVMTSFNPTLQAFRRRHGLSTRLMARALGLHLRTLTRWLYQERPLSGPVAAKALLRLAALDADPATIGLRQGQPGRPPDIRNRVRVAAGTPTA